MAITVPSDLANLLIHWDFSAQSGSLIANAAATGRSGAYDNLLYGLTYLPNLFTQVSGTAPISDLGSGEARIQLGAGTAVRYANLVGLSSAERTFSVEVKSHTAGVPVNFQLGLNFSRTATKVTTDSWVRHSITTTAAHTTAEIWNDLTNAADIDVRKPKLNAGASATTYDEPQFDWPLTHRGSTFANGGIDVSALLATTGGSGADLTAWTMGILFRQTTGSDGSYANEFIFWPTVGSTWWAQLQNSDRKFGIYPLNQWNNLAHTADSAWHTYVMTYDGTNYKVFVDGICQASGTSAALAVERDFPWYMGGFHGYIADGVFYTDTKTESEVEDIHNYLAGVIRGRGQTLTDPTVRIITEGDSITGNYPTWAKRLIAGFPEASIRNLAQAGNTYATTIVTRSTAELTAAIQPSALNVLTLWAGTNDLSLSSGTTAASVYANEETVIANFLSACAAKGARGKVLVINTLPRGATFSGAANESNFNSRRATLNALRVASSSANDIVRVELDATMGEDGDSDNVTYYSDKVHPTEATGNQYLYDLIQPQLNALLVAAVGGPGFGIGTGIIGG